MTIAEFISVERTKELLEVLEGAALTGHFLCDAVIVAAPDPGFHFAEVHRVPIGGGDAGARWRLGSR
jgi:hypothetical protein